MRELPLLLPDWPAPSNVRAVATTRIGGVSRGPFETLNLGLHVGDDPEAVQANRRRLHARLGLSGAASWLQQIHGADVVRADEVIEPPAADASWTDKQGVTCAVLTADCLPVLLCDRRGTRIAAAHGGWRGLADNILAQTVRAMGVRPSDVMAWLGPAIGPDAFEVGPDVRQAFIARWPETEAAFRAGQGDRWFCHIYSVAGAQLRALGVTSVYGGGFCTHNEPDRFFSYRRDGQTGRMASLIWLDHAAVAE